MPSKLYELRVFKGQREVSVASRLRTPLDQSYPDLLNDLLRRHLFAVAERQGMRRDQAHLFHLDVHELRGDRADNNVLFAFALPVEA
jgi:hypothetical protein